MPTTRLARSHRLAALVGLFAAATAAAQDGIATLGAELDDASGYLLFGALGGSWSNATTWDLTASIADTTTTLTAYRTTAFAGSLYHDFGAVGVRIGLGGWRDEALARVTRLNGSLDWHDAGWTVAVEGQLRQTDFDPLAVDRVIERRDGTTVTLTGTAVCAVDDVGLGARLGYAGMSWSFSISGMRYDYDNFGCGFDIQVDGALRDATRTEFVQIADRVTDVLAIGAARRLLWETSFLDNRIGLSVRRQLPTRAYSLYVDRIEDAFLRRTANTVSAGVAFPFRSSNELEVYAGVTDPGIGDAIAFLGLMLLLDR